MISGQQALRSIEQATAQVRRQEQQLDAALQSAEAELARLAAERLAAFKGLAEVKLDAYRREGIVGDLDAAERRALELLASGQRAVDALMARVAEQRKAKEEAEDARHKAAEVVTSALSELEELQARVEAATRQTTVWKTQSEAADRAVQVAAEADRKAAQAEGDREVKRKPYEADPLFMYLWTRGFGTDAYKAGNVVRFFDRKVAVLVRYVDARPNYVMLNEIPKRLREHAERCRAAVDTEQAKLVAIEKDALKQAGSGPLELKLGAAREALVAADRQLKEAEASLTALEKERDDKLGERESSVYRQAIAIVADADSREDIRELYREASLTRTPDDDALVARIESINAATAKAQGQVEQLRRDVQTLARRRVELDQQQAEFRRRGWDNPYGQFGNEVVIGDVLGGILKGAIQGHVLGEVLRGGYSQRPPRADPDFGGSGGFNFPFPGGGGGGSWGGGGGGSSGGGIDIGDWIGGGGGGDGFRTGGGF
jgi:chromosome segregation ATPase